MGVDLMADLGDLRHQPFHLVVDVGMLRAGRPGDQPHDGGRDDETHRFILRRLVSGQKAPGARMGRRPRQITASCCARRCADRHPGRHASRPWAHDLQMSVSRAGRRHAVRGATCARMIEKTKDTSCSRSETGTGKVSRIRVSNSW